MLLKKVEHIGIMVSDLERSIKWYTDVLGLSLRRRVRLGDTVELAFLTLGGTAEIELVWRAGAARAGDGQVSHLAFTVDDVAAAMEHLRSRGVELLSDAPGDRPELGARIAFFRGPDGEMLELFGG